jgi:hypothetical protein
MTSEFPNVSQLALNDTPKKPEAKDATKPEIRGSQPPLEKNHSVAELARKSGISNPVLNVGWKF